MLLGCDVNASSRGACKLANSAQHVLRSLKISSRQADRSGCQETAVHEMPQSAIQDIKQADSVCLMQRSTLCEELTKDTTPIIQESTYTFLRLCRLSIC